MKLLSIFQKNRRKVEINSLCLRFVEEKKYFCIIINNVMPKEIN